MCMSVCVRTFPFRLCLFAICVYQLVVYCNNIEFRYNILAFFFLVLFPVSIIFFIVEMGWKDIYRILEYLYYVQIECDTYGSITSWYSLFDWCDFLLCFCRGELEPNVSCYQNTEKWYQSTRFSINNHKISSYIIISWPKWIRSSIHQYIFFFVGEICWLIEYFW